MNIFDKDFSFNKLFLYFDYNLLIPFLKNNDTNFSIDNYSTNKDFIKKELSIYDQENIYKSLINYCCNKLNIKFSNNFIYNFELSLYEKIKNLNYENNIQKTTTKIDGLDAYEHYSYYFYNLLKTNKIAFNLDIISIFFNDYLNFYKLFFCLMELKYNNLNIVYYVKINKDEKYIINKISYDNILSDLDDSINTKNEYIKRKTKINSNYNPTYYNAIDNHIINNSFIFNFKNIPDSLLLKWKTTDSNEYIEFEEIINRFLDILLIHDNDIKNYSEIFVNKINNIEQIYKNSELFFMSKETKKFSHWGSIFNAQKGFNARPYEYYHWILWLIKNNIINYSSLLTLNLNDKNKDKLKLILDYANNESIIKPYIALD